MRKTKYQAPVKRWDEGVTGEAPHHCSFDCVVLPAGPALLGDRMDGFRKIADVSRGHACHGNSAILGHVHGKLLRQTLNLQEKEGSHTADRSQV